MKKILGAERSRLPFLLMLIKEMLRVSVLCESAVYNVTVQVIEVVVEIKIQD